MINNKEAPAKTTLILSIAAVLLVGGAVIAAIFVGKEYYQTQNAGENTERMTLEGEFACLPHRDTSGAQTDECAVGIRTATSSFYALNLALLQSNLISPVLRAGDRIKVEGPVFVSTPEYDEILRKYDVQGLLWVTSLQATLSEDLAIRIIKQQYVELGDYPLNGLPPRSIVAEKEGDSWHVAFVQNGSGLPIISARCFRVDNAGIVVETGRYAPSTTPVSSGGAFSPKTCSPQ